MTSCAICEHCGFDQCECQSVVANCNDCGNPIFGHEDYDRRDHKAVYSYSTFACEVCLEARKGAA